ncbi:Hypothetical predicted protein [Pelobates cultripes]|uniref:Carbonic anhydrase 4 n=1 Tax=Pelobates cultripes TaxID=61616 RepID=A0AAD1R3N0_PELCU|nr:Hypothetical predicted protein [Pelobates cultripes]
MKSALRMVFCVGGSPVRLSIRLVCLTPDSTAPSVGRTVHGVSLEKGKVHSGVMQLNNALDAQENAAENKQYDGIIKGLEMITSKGSIANVTNLRLIDLIPESGELELYYRYNGSLTTPNCDEIVTWTLFPNTIKLSKVQLEAFYKNLNLTATEKMEENFRPVQKLNGRIVQTSDAISVLSQTVALIIPVLLSFLFFTS